MKMLSNYSWTLTLLVSALCVTASACSVDSGTDIFDDLDLESPPLTYPTTPLAGDDSGTPWEFVAGVVFEPGADDIPKNWDFLLLAEELPSDNPCSVSVFDTTMPYLAFDLPNLQAEEYTTNAAFGDSLTIINFVENLGNGSTSTIPDGGVSVDTIEPGQVEARMSAELTTTQSEFTMNGSFAVIRCCEDEDQNPVVCE